MYENHILNDLAWSTLLKCEQFLAKPFSYKFQNFLCLLDFILALDVQKETKKTIPYIHKF